jgi:hypothetical protein
MGRKRQIQPDEKIGLRLSQAERALLLDGLTLLPREYEEVIHATESSKPVMLTLDDLDDLGGYVAAEANHCDDTKKRKKLDAVFEKIQRLLDTHTDEEPAATVKIGDAKQAQLIGNSAAQLAEWAATALIAAEQLGIKKKRLEHFWLSPAQREVLLLVPGITKAIKNKLAKDKSTFTVVEVASMTMALAEDVLDGDVRKQLAVMLVARHLVDQLQEAVAGPAEPKQTKSQKPIGNAGRQVLLQFKITLRDSKPPIWRRIQVRDCTLDKLHEHIQTSMGWTNAHLHRFEIGGKRFGDPGLFEEDFEEFEYLDSTRTRISQILPNSGKRFRFNYEYDFGDGWVHEVLFEGCPQLELGTKYPICLEGDRACPPEDVGGIWGYAEFLEALADPNHEQHAEFLKWTGPFDPEEFDAEGATKAMKKGLPEWRS